MSVWFISVSTRHYFIVIIYHMHNNFKCSFVLTITGSQEGRFYFHGFPKCLYYNKLRRPKFLVFHITTKVLNPLWCGVGVLNYWRERFRLPLEFSININIPIFKAHKHNPSITKRSTTSYEWTSAMFQLFFWIVYLQNIHSVSLSARRSRQFWAGNRLGAGLNEEENSGKYINQNKMYKMVSWLLQHC